MIKVLEILIFFALIICYYNAPGQISAPYLLVVISMVSVSYGLLYFHKSTRNFLLKAFLSNTNVFLLLFFVVCFQFPLDYVLGSSLNYSNYFYSFKTINLSTTFNALCFVAFVIGFMFAMEKSVPNKQEPAHEVKFKTISTKPLLTLMYILWIGFIVFLNPDYVNGGHGAVVINSISVASYGYFWRLNVIYLAISLYNNRGEKVKVKDAVKKHSLIYWFVILLSALLFFVAHNRVYTFYILAPALFYIFSITKIKTKPLISLGFILGAAIFFTLFKIYGLDEMFAKGTLNASYYSSYDRFASFSPFTSELASSIFADSILFYKWYTQGVFLLGSTLVLGVLRTISGLVPLFFSLTGLSIGTYESGSYISIEMSYGYGLGSSVSGDLLVSVGFIGALLIMFYFGRICGLGDKNLFGSHCNFKGILIGLCVSSQIIFVSRSSLSDLIGAILFMLLFCSIYFKYLKIKNV